MQDFYIKISRVGFVNSLILMMRKHQNVNQEKLITKFISINTVHYKMLNQNITNVPRKHRKCTKKERQRKCYILQEE